MRVENFACVHPRDFSSDSVPSAISRFPSLFFNQHRVESTLIKQSRDARSQNKRTWMSYATADESLFLWLCVDVQCILMMHSTLLIMYQIPSTLQLDEKRRLWWLIIEHRQDFNSLFCCCCNSSHFMNEIERVFPVFHLFLATVHCLTSMQPLKSRIIQRMRILKQTKFSASLQNNIEVAQASGLVWLLCDCYVHVSIIYEMWKTVLCLKT